jgi:hypothetical protein
MTFGIMALSIMTFNITKLGMSSMLSIPFFNGYPKCRYAECCYAECRGVVVIAGFMDKLKLTGQTLGQVFNSRSGCMSCHALTTQYSNTI